MKKILCMLLACVMVLGIIMPMATLAESTESTDKTVYANGKVWFDLNGNAKFFINTEAADYANRFTMEFLPGVDYAGYVTKPTGDFATDKAAIAGMGSSGGYGGAAMPYTTNKNVNKPNKSTPANFETDAEGNYWYTFEENTYLVRPEENVPKFAKNTPNTSLLTDEAIIKRYESLKKATLDVPDAKYKNVGLFIAIRYNYSKVVAVSLYYKGESQPEEKTVELITSTDYAADLYFNNLTKESPGTYDFNCQHAFTRIEIPTEAGKILDKIEVKDQGVDSTGKSRNPSIPIHIISAWGEETTLEEKITALSSLNEAGVSDAEGYEAVKAAVEEIDTYLVNYKASLTEEQAVVYNTAKANLSAFEQALAQEKAYAASTEWFDLNGNSKLFINTEASDYADRFTMEFLPGVDYTGFVQYPTGDFATDKAAIAYTIDKNPTTTGVTVPADFKTDADGNLWYTFENNTYLVRPEENVIKVVYTVSSTSKLDAATDADKIARYKSLKEGTTIDVPDGKYKNFGILFTTRYNYSKSFVISLYYRGETEPELKYIQSPDYGTTAEDIRFVSLNADGATEADLKQSLTRAVIETTSTKVLEKINITDYGFYADGTTKRNQAWPTHVISAWGDEATLAEKIAELATLNETGVTDYESFVTVRDIVELIDNELAEKQIFCRSAPRRTYPESAYPGDRTIQMPPL